MIAGQIVLCAFAGAFLIVVGYMIGHRGGVRAATKTCSPKEHTDMFWLLAGVEEWVCGELGMGEIAGATKKYIQLRKDRLAAVARLRELMPEERTTP